MNNSNHVTRELMLDLADLFRKLLMQWKAILLVCILMGILVSSVKYAKDYSSYKTALEGDSKTESQSDISVETYIEDIIGQLPEKDRSAVEVIVQQEQLLSKEQSYLNESVFANSDPLNQRRIQVVYHLKGTEGVDMQTLVDAYSKYLQKDSFVNRIREIVAPEARLEFIPELVTAESGIIADSNVKDTLYSISVFVPETVDANDLITVIDNEMADINKELTASMGAHNIRRIGAEDSHIYNHVVVERVLSINNTINSINNSINNEKKLLSEEQLEALNAIDAIIFSSSEEDPTASTIPLPVFSKKYVLLGLILGAFLYVGVFAVIIILKKVLGSASTAQNYTGTRLLGEVYTLGEHHGFASLFASKLIAKWLYHDKVNENNQIDALAATIDAVCAHHGTSNLSLLLSGVSDRFDEQIEQIENKCKSIGTIKSIDLLNTDKMEEKILTDVENSIYVLCSNSRIDKLERLISLLEDYDITPLGSIYLEEL